MGDDVRESAATDVTSPNISVSMPGSIECRN